MWWCDIQSLSPGRLTARKINYSRIFRAVITRRLDSRVCVCVSARMCTSRGFDWLYEAQRQGLHTSEIIDQVIGAADGYCIQQR